MKNNPVFWLMWFLPAAAVVASFATLAIAMNDADRALPAIYHWEGERLDTDFERARLAAHIGIQATLDWDAAGRRCTLTLMPASQAPRALQLQLTHLRDAAMDRTLTLLRVSPGRYRADCDVLPPGRWRLALRDDAGTWSVRAPLDGPAAQIKLLAKDPAGGGA